MPQGRIQAVLFDLGDTLLHFGKIRKTALFLEGARLTHNYLKENHQPVSGFRRYFVQNLARLQIRHIVSHATGKDFDALSLIKKVGSREGIRLSEEQWQHLGWLWYEPLSKVATVESGLGETLEALRRQRLRLGIVSNTFVSRASLERHLRQLGILDFFEVRLYSYEFEFRKPSPMIFKAAADAIGRSPANILFVGDRVDKDIFPALRIGMRAVLKQAHTNLGKRIPEGVWRISRVAELPELIEQINHQTDAVPA